MTNTKFLTLLFLSIFFLACKSNSEIEDVVLKPSDIPFTWDNANVYFLLTDRFYNGNEANDFDHGAYPEKPAPLRGYMGGDFAGITKKIKEGYFTNLGVNAIWISPVVEQIDGHVDEGTGSSFGFHGYWTKDWTALNPMFGTEEELRTLVKTAHENNIRVLLDVVANHTGPVNDLSPVWPDEWVKTEPTCAFTSYANTTNCTLVDNLPDIRTENRDVEVSLPPQLVEKWKKEGRYEQEVQELNDFFEESGFPRSAYHYILKWLTDFITDFGFDGFRVDTVKHTEEYVWSDLWKVAKKAWENWKKEHPEEAIDDAEFYMVGEVYNYFISGGRNFNFGDKKVDFFNHGFHSLINFDFKSDANKSYEEIFVKYDTLLNNALIGKSVLNYISSHDDGGPFDINRKRSIEAGTKLLLCPGGVQTYYGDESARRLNFEEPKGDAKLRSFMNWTELEGNVNRNGHNIQEVLSHWQKLGKFRNAHPAVGAGRHQQLQVEPYTFSRTWSSQQGEDRVLVQLDAPSGSKEIDVKEIFVDGSLLKDYYSGKEVVVSNGKVSIDSPYGIVLLGK